MAENIVIFNLGPFIAVHGSYLNVLNGLPTRVRPRNDRFTP